MNVLKSLGLATIASLAAMAVAGTSTASAADVLCEVNTTPCPAASKVAVGGLIKWEATDPVITASPEITCEKSTKTDEIQVNNGLVNPTGRVTAWTWTNCKIQELMTGCTITTQNLPFHVEWVTSPATSQTIKARTGGGNPGVKGVCGGFLSCTFSGTHLTAAFHPGAPAKITFNAMELTVSGAFCPAVAKLDATFVAEAPTSSLFLTTS